MHAKKMVNVYMYVHGVLGITEWVFLCGQLWEERKKVYHSHGAASEVSQTSPTSKVWGQSNQSYPQSAMSVKPAPPTECEVSQTSPTHKMWGQSNYPAPTTEREVSQTSLTSKVWGQSNQSYMYPQSARSAKPASPIECEVSQTSPTHKMRGQSH